MTFGSPAAGGTRPERRKPLPRAAGAGRTLINALAVGAVALALPLLTIPDGQAHGLIHATGATGPTPATDDPNDYTCFGHIQKGEPEAGVTGTQVKYQFSCDGPITGY